MPGSAGARDGRITTGTLTWRESKGDDPAADLLAEEALLRDPGALPALLTWSWARPVLVLGYGQAADQVDLAACRARGVPVLRRISGGTGVVHDGDLAVTLALPAEHPWAGSIPGLYRKFLDATIAALADLGARGVERPPAPASRPPRSPICFEAQDQETLRVDGRKAAGCAQARRRDAVICHATLVRRLDVPLQAALYGVPQDRIRAAIAPLPLTPEASAALPGALARAFASALGLDLIRGDRPAPPALLRDRYRDPHWAPVETGAP